jgi:hypothetical protein
MGIDKPGNHPLAIDIYHTRAGRNRTLSLPGDSVDPVIADNHNRILRWGLGDPVDNRGASEYCYLIRSMCV